jgi:hypothetical protein
MSDVNVGVPAAKNRNLMAGLDVCPKQVHPSLWTAVVGRLEWTIASPRRGSVRPGGNRTGC